MFTKQKVNENATCEYRTPRCKTFAVVGEGMICGSIGTPGDDGKFEEEEEN